MTDIVWLTITELAKRDGITKQAMHKKVHRLAETFSGLTRKQGRFTMVDVAMFELALTSHGDAAKEIGQETQRDFDVGHSGDQGGKSNSYREAQTERAQIDARIKALELEKLQGELVPVNGPNGIQAAMDEVANVILRRIELIPDIAKRLHERGLVTDQAAVRQIFRHQTDEIRQKIADDMRVLLLKGPENGASVDLETKNSERANKLP